MICAIILVTGGATGIVTKGLKTNLEAIPGKNSVDTLRKTAVLRTSIRNTESTAVCTLKLEWWGLLLFQEEKACDKR